MIDKVTTENDDIWWIEQDKGFEDAHLPNMQRHDTDILIRIKICKECLKHLVENTVQAGTGKLNQREESSSAS